MTRSAATCRSCGLRTRRPRGRSPSCRCSTIRPGSEHERGSPAREAGTSGRPAAGGGGGGGTRRWWAAAWPAASSAGGAPARAAAAPRSAPHPPTWRSQPSRTLVTAPARASLAVLPLQAILPPRKDHQQGRSGLRSPRRLLRKRRPSTDDLARQDGRLSEGRGERRDQPWRAPGILDEFRAGRSEPGASAARLTRAQSIGLRTRNSKPRCGRLR